MKTSRLILYYIFLAVLLAYCVFLARTASADTGFLNVSFSGQMPASVAQAFEYDIVYDGGSDHLVGPVQAYPFPRHDPQSTTDLMFDVKPSAVPGYELSPDTNAHTPSYGCSNTIPAGKMWLINCVIYVSGTGLINQNSSPAIASSSPVASSAPILVIDPQTTENSALIAELTHRLEILEQLVALLQQVLALQSQQAQLSLQ